MLTEPTDMKLRFVLKDMIQIPENVSTVSGFHTDGINTPVDVVESKSLSTFNNKLDSYYGDAKCSCNSFIFSSNEIFI